MKENKLDFSIPRVIEPGKQVGRMQVLCDLAEYIGKELKVPIQPVNTIVAEDISTEPTFMYLFEQIRNEIWLVAHGIVFSRTIDPGTWEIDPIALGNQIRAAIQGLESEYDSRKLPYN